MRVKYIPLSISSIILILLANCTNPLNPSEQIESVEEIESDRGLLIPTGDARLDYLGYGYNQLTGTRKNRAVEVLSGVEMIGASILWTNHFMASSSYELEKSIASDLGDSTGVPYGGFQAAADIQSQIAQYARFSSTKKIKIHSVSYNHTSFYTGAANVKLLDEARELFNSHGLTALTSNFGHSWTTGVQLGERLYFICEFDSSTINSAVKDSFDLAVIAKYNEIFFGTMPMNLSSNVKKAMSEMTWSVKAFATDSMSAKEIITYSDYILEYNRFTSNIKKKLEQSAPASFTPLAYQYSTYNNILELPAVNEELLNDKYNKWKSLKSMIQIIENDAKAAANFDLAVKCVSYYEKIDDQITLCLVGDPSASYPRYSEYEVLKQDWTSMLMKLEYRVKNNAGQWSSWVEDSNPAMIPDYKNAKRLLTDIEFRFPSGAPANWSIDTRVTKSINGNFLKFSISPNGLPEGYGISIQLYSCFPGLSYTGQWGKWLNFTDFNGFTARGIKVHLEKS